MNKNQGATAGAIVLAGILLHPFAGFSPQTSAASSGTAAPSSTNIQIDANTASDGPWIASCNYWAPSRMNPEPPDASSVSANFASEDGQIDARVKASSAKEDPCPGAQDRWGLPKSSDGVKPNITAVIALVPDPLHAHMSLDFDRSVDALLQAGADNGYISSHYWIPWKSSGSTTASQGAAETEQERAREREPGLIVLKGTASDPSSYSNVIYLFLVSDTPVLGENGSQLDLALRYEGQLQKLASPYGRSGIKVELSTAKDNSLAIIGPDTSAGAASLLAGIQHAIAELKNGNTDYPQFDRVTIAGETLTVQANSLLNPSGGLQGVKVDYTSFAGDGEFIEKTLLQSIHDSGHDTSRVALLAEVGTAFGAFESSGADKLSPVDPKNSYPPPVVIQFPHGISLLRNAHTEDPGQSGGPTAAPSPYLHLSLQDSSVDDSVTHFSQQTPLSQEAQLMGIARQLKRSRIQFISISASNVLDGIFLAKFLRRAVPDARVVSTGGGDLLYEHDTDDIPFVGALALGPYNLIGPTHSRPGGPLHIFPSSSTEALYNAASYTLWNGSGNPPLANYGSMFDPSAVATGPIHPSLWVSVVGRDGYYPVGILSDCAVDSNAHVLPPLARNQKEPGTGVQQCTPVANLEPVTVSPSLWWFGICYFILGTCIIHTACLRFANIWSPFTRDLAIDNNDEPRRRTVYVHIGTVMLFCMAVVVAYPIFPALQICRPGRAAIVLAVLTLLAGLAVLVSSWLKIRHYAFRRSPAGSRSRIRLSRWTQTEFYPLFHGIALAACVTIPALWIWICERNSYARGLHSYEGLFFSCRCLNPVSGVSAVPPVLLLLFAWYWWSVVQTWRLRFSETSRPKLPGKLPGDSFPMYVSDDQLAACTGPTHAALYDNITCLLITRQVLSRFLPKVRAWKLNVLLSAGYLVLFAVCLFGMHIETVGRIFWTHGYWWPTPLEFLVETLLFPLLMISLTGWLRMILVWGSLRRGLLIPLEQQPIRFAFSRLNRDGWMSMMRQGDLHERRREMARSIESMRQIVHSPDSIQAIAEVDRTSLKNAYTKLEADVLSLRDIITDGDAKRKRTSTPSRQQSRPAAAGELSAEDLPTPRDGKEVEGMCQIEQDIADFAKQLLNHLLLPYWSDKRTGFVEAEEAETVTARSWRVRRQADTRDLHADPVQDVPSYIRVAEEFVAIRYVSLIRAVLVNLRRLMTFISCAFVLSIVAWNSYPFQPRQWIDAAFTALLFFLGAGMVWVFAQMHRDAILSRVTKTQSNELGIDFYFRIATFGALPMLTWLAYQFPSIGDSVFKFLQPGLEVVK